LRLSQIGHEIGLLPDRNYQQFKLKREAIGKELKRLQSTFNNSDLLAKILSRPKNTYKDLPDKDETLSAEITQQVEIAVKYAGYIERQELEVEKFKNLEDKAIPATFDFSTVPSLRTEARQKFGKIRPATIGQAARISGVSPADISILLVSLKRWGAASTQKELDSSGGGTGEVEMGD
jgi:tRNA uridine 5-carboxymethylaminomethyl modification enzyme